MEIVFQFIQTLLTLYIFSVIVWALISWLPLISPGLAYNSTVLQVRGFLDSIVLPYVRLFSFVKPVQVGGTMLDLSATVAIITLFIVSSFVLPAIGQALGVQPGF